MNKINPKNLKNPILCSACLLGVKCTYDEKIKLNQKLLELSKTEILIPVCPEQLAGLPTPRPGFGIKDGRALDSLGIDITGKIAVGAAETLKIAKTVGVKKAILKQRSPSCGSGQVYDIFSQKVIEADGFAAALLKKNSIEVISEEDLQ